jgi:hypothetical protein
MKTWLLLLSVVFLCRAAAQEIVLRRIHFTGGDGWVDHCVERAEFEKVPKWEPRPGSKPPLSRDQVVEIARRTATAAGVGKKAEMEVTLETVNRYEKDLIRRLPTDGCRWFYVVELREEKRKPVYVVVSMSGAVAKPVPGRR